MDILVIGVIVLILGGAMAAIVISRKRGKKCIGCPYSGSGNCACHQKNDQPQ